MKLSEIKKVLGEKSIRLTKSLGQNFLHDANQLRRIVATAELSAMDRVLEIGPGLGALTELLVREAGEVLVIEKDRRLAEVLRQRFAGAKNLTILHDDALDYLRREQNDWGDWKVVSNLPYSVASPIIVELSLAQRTPKRITVTLQLEVARRLMAVPGNKEYGVLTLLTRADYEAQGWFKLPAGCFFPEPDVDSACVNLGRRAVPLLQPATRATYEKIVKRAFSQRRKIMAKLLKEDWPSAKVEAAFERMKLPPQARAETISVEQFAGLAESLGPQRADEIFDVVNERDEVIGQKSRSEVHRSGLKHRATHVLVYNRQGEVFLQKRSMAKDRQPGLWDSSASGHVDSGEGYDACAVRELREEIGLEAPPLQRLFKLAAGPDTDQEHVWVYRCEAEGPFTLEPQEIERGGWFAPDAVTRWMAQKPQDFATAFRVIWHKMSRP